MKHARPDYQIRIQDLANLIPAEEPVFLIRAQDSIGSSTVRCWANLAEAAGVNPAVVATARAHAEAMDAWPNKKHADVPGIGSKEINTAIAKELGWKFQQGTEPQYGGGGTNILRGWIAPGKTRPVINLPNYHGSLDACAEFEKTLKNTKPWSSSGEGDEPSHYIHTLGKVVGIEHREEVVVSFPSEEARILVNKRRAESQGQGILLPPRVIILSHHIPAYGYEHVLVMATAPQRCEAFLRLKNKWKDEEEPDSNMNEGNPSEYGD